MLLLGACLAICGLVLAFRPGNSGRALDRDDIRRLRHFADRVRRDEVLPYD